MTNVISDDVQSRVQWDSEEVKNLHVFPLESLRPRGRKNMIDGCFQRGTLVTVFTDNRFEDKKVEELQACTKKNNYRGDALLAVDGTKTFVVATISGKRSEPLLRIIGSPDNKDLKPVEEMLVDVTLSVNHMVSVDFSRVVHAAVLRKGDRIRTRYGTARIDIVDPVSPDEQVWNIFLASQDFVNNVLPHLDAKGLFQYLHNSSVGLTPKQHLLFGGGVLSGDLYLQRHGFELASLGYSLTAFV